MKPAITYREARVIRSAREVAEQCDVARARRTEPRKPLADMPREEQRAFWRKMPLLDLWRKGLWESGK